MDFDTHKCRAHYTLTRHCFCALLSPHGHMTLTTLKLVAHAVFVSPTGLSSHPVLGRVSQRGLKLGRLTFVSWRLETALFCCELSKKMRMVSRGIGVEKPNGIHMGGVEQTLGAERRGLWRGLSFQKQKRNLPVCSGTSLKTDG